MKTFSNLAGGPVDAPADEGSDGFDPGRPTTMVLPEGGNTGIGEVESLHGGAWGGGRAHLGSPESEPAAGGRWWRQLMTQSPSKAGGPKETEAQWLRKAAKVAMSPMEWQRQSRKASPPQSKKLACTASRPPFYLPNLLPLPWHGMSLRFGILHEVLHS